MILADTTQDEILAVAQADHQWVIATAILTAILVFISIKKEAS